MKDLIYSGYHPYQGQEAVAVGFLFSLRTEDVVLSTHRAHCQAVAKGSPVRAMLAEMMGRQPGVSGGLGGAMQFLHPENNSSCGSIVGSGIAIAPFDEIDSQITRQLEADRQWALEQPFPTIEQAAELTLLAERARTAKVSVEDLRGGTFTISNLGAVGGAYSTPIINHPETAILSLGRSRRILQLREGKIENRLMMPLSLSYDHRVVDGAAAGRSVASSAMRTSMARGTCGFVPVVRMSA